MLPLAVTPPVGAADEEILFDIPSLLLHLLLFERVIVSSARLREIPALARAIGVEQTIQLLESGAVLIRSGADGIASVNSTDLSAVQLVHYASRDPDLLSKEMSQFQELGIPRKLNRRLKRAVARRWLPIPAETEWGLPALRQAEADAIQNRAMFEKAVEVELKKIGVPANVSHLRLERRSDGGGLRLFGGIDGVSQVQLIDAVRNACLDIAELNGAFSRMKLYGAVSALADDCLPLMDSKLDGLWRAVAPERVTHPFGRVLSVNGLPSFEGSLQERGLDIERFLEVRAGRECLDFREFLRRSDALDEREIRECTDGLRARLGGMLQTNSVRALRMLVTTAIGMAVAGPLGAGVGLAADTVDGFLLEKMFPSSGVVTFLSEQYPSIFERRAG